LPRRSFESTLLTKPIDDERKNPFQTGFSNTILPDNLLGFYRTYERLVFILDVLRIMVDFPSLQERLFSPIVHFVPEFGGVKPTLFKLCIGSIYQ